MNPSGIIVISDTHFGRGTYKWGTGSQHSDRPDLLVKFLSWVDTRREVRLLNEELHRISFPRAIILLGDIFEFWAPLDEKIILERSYKFIDKILEIKDKGCKIVYVVGNHDTIMCRYRGEYESVTPDDFTIVRKHEEVVSAKGKSKRFVFIHGDEFEWGMTNGISTKIMGIVYRIVSDLSKRGKISAVSLFVILNLILGYFNSQLRSIPIFRDVLLALVGIFGLYAIPTIIWMVGLLVIAFKVTVKPPSMPPGDGVLAVARSVRKPTWTSKFHITKENSDKLWRRWTLWRKPRYKKLEEVVNGSIRSLSYSLEHWWKKKYQNTSSKPDVIVFGHTHTPEGPAYVKEIPTKKKLDEKLKEVILVNTGSWIKESDEIPCFLQIDENGSMMLCKFDGEIGKELGNLENPYPRKRRL